MRPDVAQPLASDFQPFGPGSVRPRRIRFDPHDPAFLSRRADGPLTVRMLAPGDALEAMVVVRGDGIASYPMRRLGAAGATSLWEAVIEPVAEKVEFSLACILRGGVPVYLTPTGISSGIERLDRFSIDIDHVDFPDAPRWASGAVIYQIFPDRFARSSKPAGGIDLWDANPSRRTFLGGDLRGIRDRVPYLADLGVDVVYLNPIFTSPSNHRYDTIDYRTVDPALGGDDALADLVGRLHDEGMRLILDVSLNHCHPRFFAFADVVAKGEVSPYAEWFDVWDWPVRVRYRPQLGERGSYWEVHRARLQEESGIPMEEVSGPGPSLEPNYSAWYGVPLMPRIELRHPEARRYMLDTARHWLREFDIDGWRMDVVRYIDHDFWAEFRREVREVKPDVFLLAEVMGDAGRWLQGDEFDAVMNYTFRDLIVDFLADGSIGAEEFAEGLLALTAMYSPTATSVNQNLIGSHDTIRFRTLAGGDQRALLLATLVQLTFPGAAGVYYGDELAMEGGADPDNRRGMAWDRVGNDHFTAVRRLIGLRRAHPALRFGAWQLITAVGAVVAYERTLHAERVVVVVNGGHTEAALPAMAVTGAAWDVGDVSIGKDGVVVGARSGAVLT